MKLIAAKGNLRRALNSLLNLILDENGCDLRKAVHTLSDDKYTVEAVVVLETNDSDYTRAMAESHPGYSEIQSLIRGRMTARGNWMTEIQPLFDKVNKIAKSNWGLVIKRTERPTQNPYGSHVADFGKITLFDQGELRFIRAKW